MRFLSKAAFAALLALGLATASRAQAPLNPLLPTTGTREIGFSGRLGIDPNSDFILNLKYGPFLNPNLQVGGTVEFTDPDPGGSFYNLGGFANYHFPGTSAALPYVGVFLGYADGSNTDGDVAYGVQGGVKYFLNSTVSAFGEIRYRDNGDDNNTDLVFGLNVYLR
jgi:hypothetical protein